LPNKLDSPVGKFPGFPREIAAWIPWERCCWRAWRRGPGQRTASQPPTTTGTSSSWWTAVWCHRPSCDIEPRSAETGKTQGSLQTLGNATPVV